MDDGAVHVRSIIPVLTGFACLSIFVACASIEEDKHLETQLEPSGEIVQSARSKSEAASDDEQSDKKSDIARGLGRIVEGPLAGAYVGTGAGSIPTMPGLIGGAVFGGLVGLVTGIQIMVTGEDPLDNVSNGTADCTPPVCEEPEISTAMIESADTTQSRDQGKSLALIPISCKTRYCGNYYGYLVVKGPSRTKKLPIKITISDGELLAATKTDTASYCLLQEPANEPIHIGVSNKFEGKYEAVCEIKDVGKCPSTIRLKGRIYEDYENAIELSAITTLRCPTQTYEMKAKLSGITTGSSNASFETTNPVEQVETLLRNVGTESAAFSVLSASTEVAR